MTFARYAIFLVPGGPFGDRGASWLGWDIRAGRAVAQPEGLAEITRPPRKYGFHATIKPPFRLAEGRTAAGLEAAFSDFCAGQSPVELSGLQVSAMGRFLALVPEGEAGALKALAAEAVVALDPFRAAPTEAELDRRRGNLNPAQEAHLARWGYPYVMDQFRPHLTLTDRLDKTTRSEVMARAGAHFAGDLTGPLMIDSLSLVGEGAGGFIEVLRCGLGP